MSEAPPLPDLSPAALRLIQSSEHAQRLIAAWPYTPRYADRRKTFRAWSTLAGVPVPLVYELGTMLAQVGAVNADGTVHRLASQVVEAVLAAGLRRGRPTPPTRPAAAPRGTASSPPSSPREPESEG